MAKRELGTLEEMDLSKLTEDDIDKLVMREMNEVQKVHALTVVIFYVFFTMHLSLRNRPRRPVLNQCARTKPCEISNDELENKPERYETAAYVISEGFISRICSTVDSIGRNSQIA